MMILIFFNGNIWLEMNFVYLWIYSALYGTWLVKEF